MCTIMCDVYDQSLTILWSWSIKWITYLTISLFFGELFGHIIQSELQQQEEIWRIQRGKWIQYLFLLNREINLYLLVFLQRRCKTVIREYMNHRLWSLPEMASPIFSICCVSKYRPLIGLCMHHLVLQSKRTVIQ